MCAKELTHNDVICKCCGYILNEGEYRKQQDEYKEQKELLERIIRRHELYVELPDSPENLTHEQLRDILSFQFMVECDMNTSIDFNPNGRINYHNHDD